MSNSGDMLAGLIALIGNDKKAAQKLADIQSKVAEHDFAAARAEASKAEAASIISEANRREAEIKSLEEKISAAAADVENKKRELQAAMDAFDAGKAEHAENVSAFQSAQTNHQNNVSALESAQKQFEASVNVRLVDLAKLEEAAKDSELAARKHEAEASAIKDKLQSKLDAVISAAKE